MRPQDLKTNTQNTPRIIFRSDVPEEGVKNGPTPAETPAHRAFEIHIERGGIHGCELQEKYNKSNDGGPKKK